MMTISKVEELIKYEETIFKDEPNIHVSKDYYLLVLKSHLACLLDKNIAEAKVAVANDEIEKLKAVIEIANKFMMCDFPPNKDYDENDRPSGRLLSATEAYKRLQQALASIK